MVEPAEFNPVHGNVTFPAFEKSTLSNGLKLISVSMKNAQTVAISFWVGAGSAYEPDGLEGISHFLEHMLFKGTASMGVGEIDRAVKKLGGFNNAYTSNEYTTYYVVVPRIHFRAAFDVLFETMVGPVFAPEEVDREREVIIEEIRERDDDPSDELFTLFQSEIFGDTRYSVPVLGWQESLRRIGREDLLSYFSDMYVPENIILVVSGDMDPGEILRETEPFLSGWPDRAGDRAIKRCPGIPSRRKRRKSLRREITQCYWALGFLFPGWDNIGETYVSEVASTVLGEGFGARLNRRLVRDEGIVTSVSSWSWLLEKCGVLGIEAVFPYGNESAMEDAVIEEIDKLARFGPRSEELKRAKAILLSDFFYSNETASDVAAVLGQYEVTLGAEEALAYSGKISAVTAEDVGEFVSRYRGDYTICSILPKSPYESHSCSGL